MSLFLVGNINAKPSKKSCKVVGKALDKTIERTAKKIEERGTESIRGYQKTNVDLL